ncbi:MAG: response regulator transcription factor [Bacteriovoracaceae bacterium]
MSSRPSILLVEDESNLGETLVEYLASSGYKSFWAQSVSEALEIFQRETPKIVIMDIGLPDGSGLDLAQELRSKNKTHILLFLSALNDPETRLTGLELGAEDYVTKPFALKELILRLDRITRNSEFTKSLPECIEHGPLKIWFQRFEVQDAYGNLISLSQKENSILELLYTNKGDVLSREEIIEKVWGEDKFPSNRTVDNYIVKLRKWCETDNAKSIEIQCVRSMGYKLIIN